MRTGRITKTSVACLVFGLIIGTGASAWSQDGDPGEGAKKQDQGAEQAPVRRGPVGISVDATSEVSGQVAERDADQAARELRFAKYMTGAKFIGRFTLRGQEGGELPKEEYTIVKCEKLDKPNMFRFTARIQYGDIDTELPMELPVVWAGDTPVISLTNLWIPGLGTFSSRVVVYQGAYAGTWSHGEKGGHLFGMIESDGGGIADEVPSGEQAEQAKVKKGPVGVSAESADESNSGS